MYHTTQRLLIGDKDPINTDLIENYPVVFTFKQTQEVNEVKEKLRMALHRCFDGTTFEKAFKVPDSVPDEETYVCQTMSEAGYGLPPDLSLIDVKSPLLPAYKQFVSPDRRTVQRLVQKYLFLCSSDI